MNPCRPSSKIVSKIILSATIFVALPMNHVIASPGNDFSYQPVINCVPTLDDFAEYQNHVKSNASADDLHRELIKLSDEIRNDENKFSDRKLTGVKRYLALLSIGNKYLQKSTLMRDQRTSGNLRLARCTKLPTRAAADAGINNKEIKTALNLFRKAAAEFPILPANDAAIYGLIVGQVRSNRDSATQYYQMFLRQYPNSTWLPAAHLSIGEYAFHRHDYPQAYEFYRKAIATQDSMAMPFAYYKLAWLRMVLASSQTPNQTTIAEKNPEYAAEVQQTIEDLKIVIDAIGKRPARTTRFDLKKEAIQDLALIWAEQNEFDAPAAYFNTIGAKYAVTLNLNRLATRLAAQRDFAGSAKALIKLLREAPMQSENPEVFEKTLSLLFYASDTSKLVETLRDMVASLHAKSPWRQLNSESKNRLEFSKIAVERSLRTYGLVLEREGFANSDLVKVTAAAEILGLYLEQFPSQNAAYDIRFAYANALARLNIHAQAVQQYLKTATAKPVDGTHLKDSWLNAIREQELLISENPPTPPTLTEPPTSQPLPTEIRRLLKIISDAPIFVPHEVSQATAKLRAAELLMSYGDFVAAETAYSALARVFPETTPGQQAIQYILDFYVRRSAWAEVVQWCQTFEHTAASQNAAISALIERSLHEALLGLASQEAARRNFHDAAKYYQVFVDRFPGDPQADSTLYNASVAFFRASLVAEGIQASLRLVKNYPKSRHQPNGLANLASAYSDTLNFAEAARYNLQFAINYPADPRAADALFNAGIIQRSYGNHVDAAAIFTRFGRSYPKDSRIGFTLIENVLQQAAGASRDKFHAIEQDHSVSDDPLHPRYYDLARDDESTIAERDAGKRRLWDGLVNLTSNPLFQGHTDRDSAIHELASRFFQLAYQDSKPILASKAGIDSRYERDPTLKSQLVEQLTSKLVQVSKIDDAEFTVAGHLIIAALHESLAATLFSVPDHGNEAATWERRALGAQEKAQQHYEIATQKAQSSNNQSLWAVLAKQRVGSAGLGRQDMMSEIFASPNFVIQPGQASDESAGTSGIELIFAMSKFPRPAHLVELASHDIQQAKETLANLPQDTSTHLLRARAYFLLGRIKDAEQDARAVITLDPKNLEARKILAKIYLASSRPEQVELILSNFIPRGPSDSDAYNTLAMAALRRSEVTRARDLFASAIQLNPNDVAAYLNLGILFLQFHDLKSAEVSFAKAHELFPDDPNAAIHLAVTESMRSNLKNAANLLEQAQSHHGEPELIYFNLAVVNFKGGDYSEALEQVDKYASLVRSSPMKLRLAENLRNAIEAAKAMGELKDNSAR